MTGTAVATEHDVMTVDQAAAFLQVSRATMYKLIKDGEVFGRRVSGRWRFTKRSLLDWIDKQD